MSTQAKTEEIKIRVDPLMISALIQIALDEELDLSDVGRRAFRAEITTRATRAPKLRRNRYGR